MNEAGRAQARALAAALASERIGSVTASDLGRARETAEIVATALGLGAPSVDDELRERRFGLFEGLTREECAARHPEAWQSWLAQSEAPAGAEARSAAIARMTRALARAAHEEPALVVSHGGVIRLFLMELLGPDVPLIGNGVVYLVEHDTSRFRARRWEPA